MEVFKSWVSLLEMDQSGIRDIQEVSLITIEPSGFLRIPAKFVQLPKKSERTNDIGGVRRTEEL